MLYTHLIALIRVQRICGYARLSIKIYGICLEKKNIIITKPVTIIKLGFFFQNKSNIIKHGFFIQVIHEKIEIKRLV